jgi:hypothetical protein
LPTPWLGQGNPNDYMTHVGIVKSVNGDQIATIEGNADPDSSVVTRHTRTLGDGFIIDFASFERIDQSGGELLGSGQSRRHQPSLG